MNVMFFVVRTDVAKDDGRQRVFGGWDTRGEAETFMAALMETMRGEFAVFEGHPVE